MGDKQNRLRVVPPCLLIFSVVMVLGGCGTLTGLPGHGGGKRFAVEQELVAAATRGAIKQIDLSTIRGKKVNLFVNAIGDTGAGNMTGGRFSIVSQLRGDYVQSPVTTETSNFPVTPQQIRQKSTTTSESFATTSTATTSSETETSTLLPYPESKTTEQEGSGGTCASVRR